MESTVAGDQERYCRDCKDSFIFTAGEQKFYEEKGFTPPSRCKPCRAKWKAERESNGNAGDRAPVREYRQTSEPIREYRTRRAPQWDQPPQDNTNERRNNGGGQRKGRRKRRDDELGGVDW